MKNLKKAVTKGLQTATDDPFSLFVTSTSVRWTFYKDTHKVLGNTFGMCVLQDFEAVTPNILAQTIETVEGGGLVILLLQTMSSLKQLYQMTMDVHSRFATEAHQDLTARFNERFLLSLSSCTQCLVMDDELNILNISRNNRVIVPVPKRAEIEVEDPELVSLKTSLADTEIVNALINCTKTLDQAKAVLTFVNAISEKTLRSTVTLTAARGRGKSAALGLAMAAAVAFGYSNIFVTSPSPENLNTLFEFIFKGFDAMEWKEHLDYELVQSTNPQWKDCIVRVNIFKSHRQTIQYIQPTDAVKLGQAELVVIDEAAAIPLPQVKSLLGPYLVFMASTINGYEGTGRSLSLKLIKQLREQTSATGASVGLGGRSLREITLNDPIRYGAGDGVEGWLNHLLCLDATVVKSIQSGCPHPSECELYYVNRDTLFSYHKASEAFLQRMMALYVSSHYKNSPNDLQLLADAPSHHLFVLLPPVSKDTNTLPEILSVIQVCLEGEISSQSVRNYSVRGQKPAGDLIPWTVSQQFQDDDFPSLSGARVVRIATHPDFQKMGYGSRALQLLQNYYEGKITNLADMDVDGPAPSSSGAQSKKNPAASGSDAKGSNTKLQEEDIKPRRDLPPLLLKLSERPAERLNYLGVSFGLTPQLFSYWKKAGFVPVYLRLTPNELTGEHTMIMLYQSPETQEVAMSCAPDWLYQFNEDFRKRFLSLLGYEFRSLNCETALLIANVHVSEQLTHAPTKDSMTRSELDQVLSIHDVKRLEGYANSLLDYHIIMDLFPTLARLYFTGRFPKTFQLTAGQQLFLIGLGHQHKTVDDIAKELSIEASQVMSYLQKIIRKMVKLFKELEEKDEMKKLPQYLTSSEVGMQPLAQSLNEDLEAASSRQRGDSKVDKDTERQQEEFLNSLSLGQYAISEAAQDWSGNAALKKNVIPNMVSVRSLKEPEKEKEKEKGKDGKPNKKKRKLH